MAMTVAGCAGGAAAALAGRVTTDISLAVAKPTRMLSSSSALSSLPSKLVGKLPAQSAASRRRGFVSMSVSVGAEVTTNDGAFADYKVSTAFLFPGQVLWDVSGVMGFGFWCYQGGLFD